MSFLPRFLGLGRPTAFVLLALGLQLPEVFRAALGDLLPTLPSKLNGGGIFRFCQNSEEVASTPDSIMHDVQRGTKNAKQELADLSAWLRRRFGSLSSIRRFEIAATRRVGPYASGLHHINSRLHIILI
jgi:hypothetical protein